MGFDSYTTITPLAPLEGGATQTRWTFYFNRTDYQMEVPPFVLSFLMKVCAPFVCTIATRLASNVPEAYKLRLAKDDAFYGVMGRRFRQHTRRQRELVERSREARTGEMEEWDDFVKPATEGEKRMVAWLEESLASSEAHWKIVIGHHAVWSGGGSKFEKAHALRALYMNALCKHADAYISGDDHMLEVYTDDCRSKGVSGAPVLPALVSGAGSKYRPLHPKFMANQLAANPGLANPFSKGSLWGFMHIGLTEEDMTVRVYSTPEDMSGRPVEETELTFKRRSHLASR
jgi:hypothetical protein